MNDRHLPKVPGTFSTRCFFYQAPSKALLSVFPPLPESKRSGSNQADDMLGSRHMYRSNEILLRLVIVMMQFLYNKESDIMVHFCIYYSCQ